MDIFIPLDMRTPVLLLNKPTLFGPPIPHSLFSKFPRIHNSRQKNQNTQDTSAMAGLCNKQRKYGYPIPNMQDLTAHLHGCTIFSKLDLKKGYYRRDIQKTAVITPFGLYEFLQMPFGLTNAGQTFQRLMDRFGAGMECVFIYLDHILIASPDEISHCRHVYTVLSRLLGLILNLSKCRLGLQEVELLGY